MTDKAVVLMAADLIEERGLLAGSRVDRDGRMCVLGALDIAKYGDAWSCKIDSDKTFLKSLADALSLPPSSSVTAPDAWRLADWSNGQSSKHVVAAALRVAAEKL